MALQAWIERVPLRHVAPVPQRLRLREPAGNDELAVGGVDTRSAVQLLDRLIDASPCRAEELSASDRDALLAGLHRFLWGDHIVCSLDCPACKAMFDLSFELSTLQRHLAEQGLQACTVGIRSITDEQGVRFELPSADGEIAASEHDLETGVALLIAAITGSECGDADALGEQLEGLAPLIDLDFDAHCVECGHGQLARFDIQSFVLQRLLDEREGVLSEVHALAISYGWSLSEILGLPRSLRRSLVQRLMAVSTAFG